MTKKELLDSTKQITQIARESYVKSFLDEPNDINRKSFWETIYHNIIEQNQKLMQSQTALTNHNISLHQPTLASSPQMSSDHIDRIVEDFFCIPVNDDLSNANSSTPNQDNFEQEIYRILNCESPPNQAIKNPTTHHMDLNDDNPSFLKKSRLNF
jgi:hypothetical protein